MIRKLQLLLGACVVLSVVPAGYFFARADTALQKHVAQLADCEQRYGGVAPSEEAEPNRYKRFYYTCDTSHRGSQISRLTRERYAFAHKSRLAASLTAGLLTLLLGLFMVAWFIGGQRAAAASRRQD